ncbi:3-hydroxyacyl-CoA dehydrogenase NAD-binding domain-containing protein [Planctomicrobium sp. SH527]|uniref:3-hydroxyacyl-CoA dehydrogenase NAD-binding domain-containing protein n=1 Tax=Planctomicrobium sp. SH527 TaxID=3448123 RepID=UPI003F5B5F7D
MLPFKNFKTVTDDRGVMTVTLDVPDRPVNVIDDSVLYELNEIINLVEQKSSPPITLLVFRSGKPSGFLAGADVHRLRKIQTAAEADIALNSGQMLFNRIEALKVPTIAAIHGPCLGGGLEFALACKFRVAVDDSNTRLGLPEVKLGLIPAWGGTQRLPKQVGLSTALPMLLQGKLLSAKEAHRCGLVNRVISADNAEAELSGFINRRLDHDPVAPKTRDLKQWLIDSNPIGRIFAMKQARREIVKLSVHYPALCKILDAVEIGLRNGQVTEAGLAAERTAFKELLLGKVAPHLIDLFLNQELAKKSSTWTDETNPEPVKRILVLGAGTMGAGIAQLAASRGFSVLLQDVKEEYINRGMETIRDLFAKAVKRGILPKEDAELAGSKIQTRVNWGPSDDVDLMVEAIVEQIEVKRSVFTNADTTLPMHSILASNTSALPIEQMAKVTGRPEKVAGLHFFNPVHKMPLVEVVRAPQTSDNTIAVLVSVAKKLGKVPVVVKQSPGFLVNRILFPYLDEAARLSTEGERFEDIDAEAKKFGMPMGPLELLDVIGLDVALDVSKTLSPLATQSTPSPALFQSMVVSGSKGQKSGKGFYSWQEGKKKQSLPKDLTGPSMDRIVVPDWVVNGETFNVIQQRLILSMVNESQKCVDEGVVAEPWMVDLGMVLGTGFAPFRGGPMTCIEQWGREEVKARLLLLEKAFGQRFRPANGFSDTTTFERVPYSTKVSQS